MLRCTVLKQTAVLALATALTLNSVACGNDEDKPGQGSAGFADSTSGQIDPSPEELVLTEPGQKEPPLSLENHQPAATEESSESALETSRMESSIPYVIQPGDTLWEIAARFGTTVDVIVDLNGMASSSTLNIGQVILLPDPDNEGGDPETHEGIAPIDDDGIETRDTEDTETGLSPDTIPQPTPDITVSEIPKRPDDFSAYGAAALPWLQGRTAVSEILPLFVSWAMPSMTGGDRLHLVDSDLDGLFSILIVYTDPASYSMPLTTSNLVIYDPIPTQPDRYRMAYDHRLHSGVGNTAIIVRSVRDLTGDGRRDLAFTAESCGTHTCTTSLHVLVRFGNGYRDAVIAPIDIPTVTSLEIEDRTDDGLLDITIEGGTFGSVDAGPPRSYRYLFSGAGGTVQQIEQVGLSSDWMVWAVIDANESFSGGDYAAALTLYERVLTSEDLEEWMLGGATELLALSHLRQALAYAVLGDTTAATWSAQEAITGSGLIAELSTAFLGGFVAAADVGSGCIAFNAALALRSIEWENFWSRYGYGVPRFPAEDICPL